MIEIGSPTLLQLGPGIIAISIVCVMLLLGASFSLGVKAGRVAENQRIGEYILEKVGYDSLEEWEAAIKKDKE